MPMAAAVSATPFCSRKWACATLGPIDGHNLPLLISTLESAKQRDHPIVIHILTQKGKGFDAALKQPEKISTASDPITRRSWKPCRRKPGTALHVSGRDGPDAGEALPEKRKYRRAHGRHAHSGTGLKHSGFFDARPLLLMSASPRNTASFFVTPAMATMGYRPVVAIYSTFLQSRFTTASIMMSACKICR